MSSSLSDCCSEIIGEEVSPGLGIVEVVGAFGGVEAAGVSDGIR